MTTTEAEPRAADTEHEGWATGWVTIGLVLGPLGATIGVYLVLRSTRWSARWKAAALAVPMVLVVIARTSPKDGSEPLFAGLSLCLLAVAVAATYVLKRAAARGSGHARLPWFTALPIALLLVAGVSDQLGRLHAIGSYDYHDDVVAAAREADRAGERYGVVTESFEGDENPLPADIERLAGPGNARFIAIFDKLEDREGGFETSKLSRRELGTCYVFPVLTSRSEGIESVAGLSRHCTGPSEAASSVRLSNR